MKILSVDDNAENRYLIEVLGQANGFEVVSARNGLEALEILDTRPVDLIVSDVLMPEMDGFQLCHEVKSRERTRRIPFIFYTATYTAAQDAELGLSLGASRYVLKPVEPDQFMTILGEVISEAQKGEVAVSEGELKGTVDYLKAYTARLVHKLDRKIEQLNDTRNELQSLLAARDSEIAQRRRAEQALAASEARFRALLESAPQGVIAVDEGGHIVLVNARTEETFGYTRDELIGQPLELLLPERFRKAHLEHQKEYFSHPRTRTMGLGLDLWGRKKDGTEFPLEVSLSIVEEGEKELALALVTDITERRQAEEHRRQAQKLESIGILASGIAHDFNNLLVGVLGNASLARDVLPPGSPAIERLDAIVKTGEQAAHLTRQMLAYAGKGQFLIESLNLSDLLPEIIGLVQPSISKKIALHLNTEPDLPGIEADRGQVQQVFMNLVLNAAEAIGSYAGMISIRTGLQNVDAQYIRLNLETQLHPGKYVCLAVQDTGCGMDEKTMARIFDPFFSTKFQGRGLGLAAVAGIVRSHKGAITVSSAPGKGACFTVLFPAAEGDATVAQVADQDLTLRGIGTILVVDDDPSVRELAKKMLETYGYRILLADGGLSAVDIFKRHPGEISLVILDASMPGMSGEETLPELLKIRPGIKVLVSSGYSESETMRGFVSLRATGFIQKPYTSSQLAEKVKSTLT